MSEVGKERRAVDPRIDELVRDMSDVKKELAANTEITKQVADVLASFRVISAIAKWATAVGAAIIAIKAGWNPKQ